MGARIYSEHKTLKRRGVINVYEAINYLLI